MLRTMTTATNTMAQLQNQFDVIGNNLANSATHGFKAREASFHEMLYQQYNNDQADRAPRQSPAGVRYGVGAVLGQAQINWKTGSLQSTDRELDFALTVPKQYFNILRPAEDGVGEETVYTRQGNFYVSPVQEGLLMLVNGDGYPVADVDGLPILFPDDVKNYTMVDNGILTITRNDGTTETAALGVTVLERPNLMEQLGGNYVGLPNDMEALGLTPQDVQTNLVGAARNNISMQNGMLETSNVNYQKEMTDLITAQRSYQFNARAVTIADQMLGLINGIR